MMELMVDKTAILRTEMRPHKLRKIEPIFGKQLMKQRFCQTSLN
jgi:hypothetical protein